MRKLLDPDTGEGVTRKNNTRASVSCIWDDLFFYSLHGYQIECKSAASTRWALFSEDCICTLSCGAALGTFTFEGIRMFQACAYGELTR